MTFATPCTLVLKAQTSSSCKNAVVPSPAINTSGTSFFNIINLTSWCFFFLKKKLFRALNTAFQIKHYAGDVTYEVDGFCDKNKDTLFDDLIEVMQMSENRFLVAWFPEDTKQVCANANSLHLI